MWVCGHVNSQPVAVWLASALPNGSVGGGGGSSWWGCLAALECSWLAATRAGQRQVFSWGTAGWQAVDWTLWVLKVSVSHGWGGWPSQPTASAGVKLLEQRRPAVLCRVACTVWLQGCNGWWALHPHYVMYAPSAPCARVLLVCVHWLWHSGWLVQLAGGMFCSTHKLWRTQTCGLCQPPLFRHCLPPALSLPGCFCVSSVFF